MREYAILFAHQLTMKFPAKYWMPGFVIVATATEIALRLVGLGNPVLSQADPDTGYRFQPNQQVFRFGKHIEYNQYSQRSEPITPKKPQGKLRILMLGDSVLNGGNPTDQKQTITELFEAKLSAAGHPAEVLNASAGSWGIGNQLGYLRKFGSFESDAVIVEIGTHDLTQPTSTSDPVGHHPAFPTHPPLLAMQEALTRYAWPNLLQRFGISSLSTDFSSTPTSLQPAQQFQQNMQSLEALVKLVRAKQKPFFVLFVPEIYNLVPVNKPPQYKPELLQKLKSLQVPVIDAQAAWSTLPKTTVETYFRDGIHPSEKANQAVANLLFQQCIITQLPSCLPKKNSP